MSELSFSRRKRYDTYRLREVFSWTLGIFLAIFFAIVLNIFFGTTIRVVGKSMEPLLYNGQKVYLDTFKYMLSSPQKGDVVVFLPNGNEKSHYYVKRVVATAGDKVIIRDGMLYVNDLPSIWVFEELEEEGIATTEITIEKGKVFCLGDNPDEGEDSRSSNLGMIDSEEILGKVWFRAGYQDAGMGFIK